MVRTPDRKKLSEDTLRAEPSNDGTRRNKQVLVDEKEEARRTFIVINQTLKKLKNKRRMRLPQKECEVEQNYTDPNQ